MCICWLGPRESNIVFFYMQTMPANEVIVLDVSQNWQRVPKAFNGEVPTLIGAPPFTLYSVCSCIRDVIDGLRRLLHMF